MEMDDTEFAQLQLRATICPQQARWPASEHVHWKRLHEAATEARERVSRAYTQMDEIDRKADLSREGKERQRRRIAAQAVADLEASRTLERARETVRYVVEQWKQDDISPEIAEAKAAMLKTLKEAEVGWQRAIDKIAERASLTRPLTHKPAAIGGWLA
jgi:hypothetical protein